MRSILKKRWLNKTGLLALAVLFVALVSLSNVLLRGARLDLTQNGLYTLTDGTKNILANLNDPIQLYFFYSDQATADVTDLRAYAKRVQETLEEFEARANGKLQLSVIDPVAFSEQEDLAKQFGLPAVTLPATGGQVYFGLAGSNAYGDEDIIGFFEPSQSKAGYLEYDLAKFIYGLNQTDAVKVGVYSSLPLAGQTDANGRQGAPWVVYQQLSQQYELVWLDANADIVIDDELDALMVVHPKSLSEASYYAIDQFVLSGRPLVLFVDPFAEIDLAGVDPADPLSAYTINKTSRFERLLTHWGVSIADTKALLDQDYALRISFGQKPVAHLGMVNVPAAGINQDDVATAQLAEINLSATGVIAALASKPESALTLTSLLESSERSGLVDTDEFKFLSDPASLQSSFKSADQTHVLAARLSGSTTSAFSGAPGASHLTEGTAQVVLVADADVLSDRLWTQVNYFVGRQMATPFASNGAFVINVLDNLVGSQDLIGARGRQTFRRPFEKVEAMRAQAEATFKKKQQGLQAELAEVEKKLEALQVSQTEAGANVLMLSNEQRNEILEFKTYQKKIQKQLRKVQHELNKDIDRLGTKLKVINIVLMPLLVMLFAWWRIGFRSRRLRQRSAT